MTEKENRQERETFYPLMIHTHNVLHISSGARSGQSQKPGTSSQFAKWVGEMSTSVLSACQEAHEGELGQEGEAGLYIMRYSHTTGSLTHCSTMPTLSFIIFF